MDKIVDIIKEHYLSSHAVSNSNGIPNEQPMLPKIHSIYVYPIKSCAPFKVSKWSLDSASLLYDRAFAIMQGRKPLTQKILPMMCLIKPTLDLVRNEMRLSYPDVSDFVLNLSVFDGIDESDIKEQSCVGKVCGDMVEGLDCGPEVTAWLEMVTGLLDIRLVKLVSRIHKTNQNNHNGTNDIALKSFANEGQFLVLNLNSAKELEKHLPETAYEDAFVDNNLIGHHQSRIEWIIEQFRGNIVMSGIKAFEEENVRSIRIKSEQEDCFTLDVERMCTRCNVISVNQTNGDIVQEPLKTLTKMEGRNFKFGVLASLRYANGLSHSSTQPLILSTNCDIDIMYKNTAPIL